MLSTEEAKKIGISACIDKLGRDFVQAYRDFATSAYSEGEDSVFCFVGVDDSPVFPEYDGTLVLDSLSPFPYRVSCNVALEDGSLSFLECILPSGTKAG